MHRRSRSSIALEKGPSSGQAASPPDSPKKKRHFSVTAQKPSSRRATKLSISKYYKVVGSVAAAILILQLWRLSRTSSRAPQQPSPTPDPVPVPKVAVRDVDVNNAIISTPEATEKPWEITAEEVPMQVVSPSYSVRVLRSILTHSNHTYQDMPNEAHGYLIQTFLWLHVVRKSHADVV